MVFEMVATRAATRRDGDVLREIMAKAPQGSDDLRLTLTAGPDFFGRARQYAQADTFVAEAEGALAGSAAVAVRNLRVGAERLRVGYEFQYFVSPDHRRKGVAGRLRERIEDRLLELGADWTTAIVADSNAASWSLFERHGFRRLRDLPLTFVFVTQHTDVRPGMGIRPAGLRDLPRIADLLRSTWAAHDFTPDWELAALFNSLRRVLGPDLEGLVVREVQGRIVACAGIWDWSAIQQIVVDAISPELQPLFPTFYAGQPLRQWGLTAVGFREPEDVAPLLRHLANRALGKGIGQIGVLDLPGLTDVGAVFGLPVATIGLGLYGKPLAPGLEPPDGPLYVDIVDL